MAIEGHDETIGWSVNSDGIVVGMSDSSGPGVSQRGALWHEGKAHFLHDLTDLPPNAHVSQPFAISDSGIIVGRGTYLGGSRAFRLTPRVAPAGDLDGDCRVSGADLAIVLQDWGVVNAKGDRSTADLNGDGMVDGSDLGIVLSGWTG